MKKVTIVYSGAKHQGGVEECLFNIFDLYDRKKVELSLISLGEWPLCKRIGKTGAKIHILSGKRTRPKTFFDIRNIAKEEDIDLIVSQGVVANFYARVSSLISKVPHLTMVPSDLESEYSNPIVRFFYKMSDYVTRPVTKKYIASSEYLKKRLVSKGIETRKVKVIYNAVKVPRVKARKNGEIVIGSAGRLDHVKGYDNLIKAFSMLGATDAKLVIWGEGNDRGVLEGLIKNLKLTDKVSMPGHVDDIGEALSQIDIYIQPSLSEGFGLAVVEAMLAKKPVIVTPAGALKEIIEDGETGFVAKSTRPKDIAKAIERVFDNFGDTPSIVEKAEQKAKNEFSLSGFVNETVNVYLETVGK